MAMATATVLLRLLASEELKMGREGTRGDRIGQDRDAARQTLVDCASSCMWGGLARRHKSLLEGGN
jgi:hypothetical protein